MSEIAVSVVICTYNRCEMLSHAITSVLTQIPDNLRYELIVVDNNSSDDTRRIVEAMMEGAPKLRYVFEARQGLSHARNAGIAAAQGSIIAFTDDDIRAGPEWIANIIRAFEEYPDVDIVGGKVLPSWNASPPRWLTDTHWSPLALMDHGNEPFYVNIARQQCMVGANLCVRREVFDEVGVFAPIFQRVKDGIGSTEDHEFQLRFWRAGKQGLYAPDIVVTADVQDDRLGKAYHRRWHKGHGAFCAMMQLLDIPADSASLFGTPAYVYSSIPGLWMHWMIAAVKGQESRAFSYETDLRFALSYIKKTYEMHRRKLQGSTIEELTRFSQALFRKKFSSAARIVKRNP